MPKLTPEQLLKLVELKVSKDLAKSMSGNRVEVKGEKGDDGKTPQKGIDYWTENDVKELVRRVMSNITLPVKGKDYFTEEEVDGIVKKVKALIPEPEKVVVNYDKIISEVTNLIPIPEDGQDGSPDTPEEVRDKLESLKGENRLDAFAIKNLEDYLKESETIKFVGGGGSSLTVRKDGAIVGSGTAINFTGSGVSSVTHNGNTATVTISGGGGTWGSITGTLSNQTDLQSALDAKQPLDAQLTSLAALVPGVEGRLIISDGLGGFQMTAPSSFISDNSILVSGDNVSELTNDAGYLTSYTETQTLQDVTDLGATTTNAITVNGLTSNSAISIDNAANLNMSATTNSDGQITGIGRATFVNNGYFGTSTGAFILFNDSIGSLFSKNVRMGDNLYHAFGDGRDYSLGYHSASDTLQIVDGSTLNSNVRFQLDSTGNIVVGSASTAGLGIAVTPDGSHKLMSSSDATEARWWLSNTDLGESAWSNTMPGIELSAGAMNTTFKYTPAIKFGSTDSDLTTTNPKFNAYIMGYVTEAYSTDTRTGMGLEFGVSPKNSSTGSVATAGMKLEDTGLTVLSTVTIESTTPSLTVSDTDGNMAEGRLGADNGGIFFASDTNGLDFRILTTTSGGTLTEALRVDDAQQVGIGTGATISAALHVIDTAEQLRIGSDTSNYASFTVNASGSLTIETPTNGITLVSNSTSTAGGIVFQREPDLATDNRYSVMNTVQAATTNSPSANASFTAIDFTPRYSGTGTLKTLYGAFFSPLNPGTGTVTNLTGSAYWVRNTSTGTVTTMKGVEVLAPTNSGTIGGSVYGAFINNQGLSGVTNSYGLFISAQSGSTNNYAIKTGTGLVDFGDDVSVTGNIDYDTATGGTSALGNLGATEAVDWATATHFTGTLDSNVTITHSNESAGQKITLALAYDGTAQRTITWSDVDVWEGGSAPTAPSASGETLVVTLVYLGTTCYGSGAIFS